jgi:hypothetical protein
MRLGDPTCADASIALRCFPEAKYLIGLMSTTLAKAKKEPPRSVHIAVSILFLVPHLSFQSRRNSCQQCIAIGLKIRRRSDLISVLESSHWLTSTTGPRVLIGGHRRVPPASPAIPRAAMPASWTTTRSGFSRPAGEGGRQHLWNAFGLIFQPFLEKGLRFWVAWEILHV